jgi:hypothetical protein
VPDRWPGGPNQALTSDPMVDPHGHAATAIRPLEVAGVTVTRPTRVGDVAEPHGLFLNNRSPAASATRARRRCACRPQRGHPGECLGPSWGRDTAVTHGQPRSPTDSWNRSSTAISAIMKAKIRIWHARGHGHLICTWRLLRGQPRSVSSGAGTAITQIGIAHLIDPVISAVRV